MKTDKFFSISDEIGQHPRLQAHRPAVFPNTGNLRLTQVDRPWARWSGGKLGPSGIDLWRVETTGHDIDLVNASKWSYHLPLAGSMSLTYRRSQHALKSLRGALLTAEARTTRTIAPRSGIFESVVLIPPTLLEDPFEAEPRPSQGHIIPETTELQGFVLYLFQMLSRPGSPLASARVLQSAGVIFAELYRDALVRNGELARAKSAGERRVQDAEAIMRHRFDDIFSVTDVARDLGVSVRSLQMAFREHRGQSPRDALVGIRLDEARRSLLMASDDGTSVTDAAMSAGFTHLGRFAAAYRRAFGEAPSDTLRRRITPRRRH